MFLILQLIHGQRAELSSQRRRIAAVAAGNKIFFAGGENGGGDFVYTDVDIYDVATDTWSLSHMSTEGDGLTTATTGNKVFFAAGDYGIYATSTVNIYDLTSNSWSTASLSAPRNISLPFLQTIKYILLAETISGQGQFLI